MNIEIKDTLISEEQLQEKVKELALQIERDFEGEEIIVIAVLKGSFVFAADLIRHIKNDVTIDFISASSYGNQTETTGKVKLLKDIDVNITGKNVIVVEDIIDSGLTLHFLKDHFFMHKPKALKFCTLLDKPERRKVDLKAEYVGFQIPDEFIVGYGIDCAEKYRNLPFIASVVTE
ncbi:hypoxanthine phosphoribosyltransferase [Bacillus mobilis]|uniref:Hypoxanthine phosphoribosyltransferase n=2 Tax=Bacillus cereus group TaxID=86661 RepID=A0A1C4F718_BACCE|nr:MULTISPECIES: hypoxanthine phosphoribosyltransferase [Bacillus cereus group]EKS7851784.1 hypoxanthine phosphoribosyltransferase [Bacillus wiedmannii]EOQ08067.1 hypoxanthine phosphoribosyltransferase [Bacillus cereus B5-2]EOQ24268.1 hypoxanthine phosphoribosyltransferase [Bacillus cereus BAG3O-1]PFW84577.1 hypoxanthine phosphoribosyltransferase [Bacillus sp. AFS075960]RFB09017.1 hypoxanthine phosphoribosyltransferase [Bacillus sp. OE]RFB20029.1 hypoxanthine phosphoribosyltransferase [Bacill